MRANVSEMYKVIVAPLSTEKANNMSDRYNRLVFKVAAWANKAQIKTAVENIFSVKVLEVATLNVKGKLKKFKQQQNKKSDWKKAVVKLQSGQDIRIAEYINQ